MEVGTTSMSNVRRGVYIAIDSSGNVYGGQSMNLPRRKWQHAKNGLTTIMSVEVEPRLIIRCEKRLIRFLVSQSEEEQFACINVSLRGREHGA